MKEVKLILNKGNLIKSSIMLFVLLGLILWSINVPDEAFSGYLYGVFSSTIFMQISGISKWSWGPVFRKEEK